jgi:hypothetical protein
MYRSAVLAAVMAVKYPLGTNVNTSSVLGSKYNVRVGLPDEGITQLLVAVALSCAKDKNAPCVVEALMMRYWLPPAPTADATCTGDGADVDAVILYVFPVTENAADTLIAQFPLSAQPVALPALLSSG